MPRLLNSRNSLYKKELKSAAIKWTFNHNLSLLLGLLSVTFFISAKASQAVETEQLEFEPCQIQLNAQQVDAECASLTRPENPAVKNTKTIELFVSKLPSTSPTPAEDAFTLIQGGPGMSSIDLAISYKSLLDIIRTKRDVLVIDQRGTGRSNKLSCDLGDNEEITSSFDPELTAQLTQNCVAELKANDLRAYTTSVAVQDLEAMRKAAGYEQLSIYGVSYGTRVGQHYLRKFPDKTRALIIDGVVDIGLNLAGSEIARRSQDAFDQMVKRCNDTPSCVDELGDIKTKFTEVRQRLKDNNVTISTVHPLTGKPQETTITEGHLLGAVRLMPYSTEGLSLLPLLISDAHSGSYTTLAAQAILTTKTISKGFAIGMHNSVTCTEDAQFVSPAAAQQAEGTYFGSLMIDNMRVTCENWPKGIIDDDFLKPFDAQQPVLIMSGATDPITPPANGERTAKMFSNSKHLIVPSHGHGVVVRGCLPFIVKDFLEQANLDDINDNCIERENAMPFFIDPTGPTP